MPSIDFLVGMVAGAGLVVFWVGGLRWQRRRSSKPLTARETIGRRAEEILEDLPVPVFVKSAEGIFLMVNRAFELRMGVPASGLIDTDGSRHWSAEEMDRRSAHDRGVFEAGQLACSELSLTSLTAQESRQFLIYKMPFFDASGHPLYLIGVCIDITERKQAEAALRASKLRWKFALEGSGDGVSDWDVQTGKVMYSSRWKSMLGFDDGDIGDTLDEWQTRVHPDDARRVDQSFQRYLEQESGTYVNEHRLRCKDGSYKWILARGMVTDRDDRQRPLRMIGISTDITEARQTEAARLAHMARQRDLLVAEVHHRVKNSLQGVVGLLRQHKAANGDAALTIERAIAQVQTIALVYGLQGQTIGSEVVLCEMVPGIAKSLETLLLPRPSFDIEVDVPKRVRVNEQETVPIALIVNELIVNAVKHSHAGTSLGGACVGIVVHWDGSKEQARVIVRNRGCLVPEFDFASGKGIGTGLDLVRLLLPPQGASLSFSSANAQVEVALSLDMPSIYRLDV